MRVLKGKLPLNLVKPICMAATLLGAFFLVSGSWVAGLCMLLGSYLMEKSLYCCHHCGKKLDMKHPFSRSARCPFCKEALQNK